MRKISGQISIFVVFLFLLSCNKGTKYKNNDFEIIRYDKMLFEMDLDNIKEEFDSIKSRYPIFTNLYFEKVINIPGYKMNDSLFLTELKFFISDTAMQQIYKLGKKEFGNMEDLNEEFGYAIDNYYKKFPNHKKIRVYSYISGFSLQRFIFEDSQFEGLAFATDLFLGNKFNYQMLEKGQNTFSAYLTRTYNKEHIVKKTMELLLNDKLGVSNGVRAIDFMIKNAKVLYSLKQIIPKIPDTILFEYSKKQLEWLNHNEQEMWSFYIKNNLFYTSENYKIKRLTYPNPTSQSLGMPRKSPGRTGNYLGYRILETYMNKHPELDLETMLEDYDSQKILEKSKFKPKRF